MLSWMITNYKAVIGYMTAALTVIAIPIWIAAGAFIFRTEVTNATVPRHEERITKLERSGYATEALVVEIRESLRRIEDREYQELKLARQLRQASKP